jgi:hypothetical protein
MGANDFPPTRSLLHPVVTPLIAFIGAIVGATITGIINSENTTSILEESRRAFLVTRQENTARQLLTEIIELLSLKEAWLLQGPNSRTAKLTDTTGLGEHPEEDKLWLMPVEIRAVLDEAEWNAPLDAQYYGFFNGRRAWIVRNRILDKPPVYPGRTLVHYPALLSSKGWQELSGWIERVRIAHDAQILTDEGLLPMKGYLRAVDKEDRITFLSGAWLSPKTIEFLRAIRGRQDSAAE